MPAASLSNLYKDKDWPKFKNKTIIPLGIKVDSPTENQILVLENMLFNLLVDGKEDSIRNNFFHCAMSTLLKTHKQGKLKFILIGKKKSKLTVYKKLPNLLFPVMAEPDEKKEAIEWCLAEINRRIQISYTFKGSFDEYNQQLKEKLPRLVVIVEGLDELMKDNKRFYQEAFRDINLFSTMVGIHFLVGISKLTNPQLMQDFFYKVAFKTGNLNELRMLTGKQETKKIKDKNEFFYNYGRLKESPLHLRGYSVSEKEIKRQIKEII